MLLKNLNMNILLFSLKTIWFYKPKKQTDLVKLASPDCAVASRAKTRPTAAAAGLIAGGFVGAIGPVAGFSLPIPGTQV
jgi:hypothetical protein